jgi:hypothetical protein
MIIQNNYYDNLIIFNKNNVSSDEYIFRLRFKTLDNKNRKQKYPLVIDHQPFFNTATVFSDVLCYDVIRYGIFLQYKSLKDFLYNL